MRFVDADLIKGEVPRLTKDGEPNPKFPHDGRCKTGHLAPPKTTRFYALSGKVMPSGLEGIYCEYCVTVTTRAGQLQRKGLPLDFDPRMELVRLLREALEKEKADAGKH
jgi:hypothetical protein